MNIPAVKVPKTIQRVFILLLVLSFALPIVFNKILDVDIWWHLQLGRSALSHLGYPDLDAFYFSHLQHTPSVYRYTLLGDILLFGIHRLAGDVGLQLFGAVLVAFSGFVIWGIARPRGPYLLLASLVFIATTYQLQIMRNAIFSLPLFCLLIRIWWEARYQGREKAWWLLAPLLTFWSFLHGSYLVGFGMFCLMALGDVLDHLRQGQLNFFPWRPYLASGVASALGISLFNSLTFQLASRAVQGFGAMALLIVIIIAGGLAFGFKQKGWTFNAQWQQKASKPILGLLFLSICLSFFWHFRQFFGRDLKMTGIDLLAPGTADTEVSLGFLGRLKFGLNNLFWKTAEEDYFSSDFLSPFDGLGEIYIWLTFALGFLTIVWMIYRKHLELVWIFPLLATIIFALGYKRMVGYWALFSLCVLSHYLKGRQPEFSFLKPAAWVLSLSLWLFFWGGFGLQLWDPGLRSYHFPGFGRAPMFSEKAAQAFLEKHPRRKVFNTVANGGFLLSQWYPRKKIFIDGFFAPHRGTPLKAYQSILFGGDPDELVKRLGLKTALINLYDLKWFLIFNKAPNWYPQYVDQGMAVFVYQPKFRDPTPKLDLLLDPQELKGLPPSYRRMIANRIFQIQTGYLLKGRIIAAKAMPGSHTDLFGILPAYAEDRIREETERNLSIAEKRFGDQDNKWLRDEYLYQEALRNGNQRNVRYYGGKIFDAFPTRFELALFLLSTALNGNHVSEAKRYLLALDRAVGEDPEFFKENQAQIAEHCYRASKLMGTKGQPYDAYEQLEKAYKLAPERFHQDVLLNDSLGYYEKLILKNHSLEAYQLLIKLETHLPENPFIQHLLAATVRQHATELKLPLESALRYAEKALELGKGHDNVPLDAFRENVALILDALGRPEEAATYRH